MRKMAQSREDAAFANLCVTWARSPPALLFPPLSGGGIGPSPLKTTATLYPHFFALCNTYSAWLGIPSDCGAAGAAMGEAQPAIILGATRPGQVDATTGDSKCKTV